MIGWIGLGALMGAYVLLSFKNTKRWFIPVDTIASAILTVHAIMIKDIPFIIVNGWIAIILARQWIKRDMEVDK